MLQFDFDIASSTLSPEGERFCTIRKGDIDVLVVGRIADGEITARSPIKIGGAGSRLKWSPDGKFIGSVQAGRLAIYRPNDLSLVSEISTRYPSDIDLQPNGQRIALACWDGGSPLTLKLV